ncbi:protein unc-13 homolog [Pistacia vera]|uniref:protein unc-13 homolog n=1 Tax=Pistacia vera TaxID=55513 RepID=UPI001263C775|nr:protein unc-13 homolog [Pistacia vera]
MERQLSLLERYRRDRRQLIEFLLSSGLIKELRTSSGSATSLSNIDFDSLSADYILHCVKSGGVVNVSEATKKYVDESAYPVLINSQLGDSYFLISDPDSAGSPPRRVPPPISVKRGGNSVSRLSSLKDPTIAENVATPRNDYGLNKATPAAPMMPTVVSGIPPLGLPSLKTGLSDDDLRESAYELLVASMLFSWVEVNPVEDRKKEKSSKFLSGLKSKKDKLHLQSQSSEKHSKLFDIVRVQMQISEAMGACTKRNLIQLAARRSCGQVDLPQISLGLLLGTFKSDFLNEKSYMQWKSRQANILEELLYFSANVAKTEHLTIRSCLEKIRDTKEWDLKMSASERVEVLSSVRQLALKISSLPGKFGLQSETYYWTADYHLNIRLYEKLLFGMFDILDECQFIEEFDTLQSLINMTWSTLGITQKMHYALFGWVLFQQFVATGEGMLVEHAVIQLQKVSTAEEYDKEGQYMNSLVCSRQCNDREVKLSLVQAIFLSISIWCDNKLQDYHLHFNQQPANFKRVISLASAVGLLTSGNCSGAKLAKLNASNDKAARKLKRYVKKSIEAACTQVANTIDLESKVEKTHPLALLANELKLIAERQFIVFWPVLCHLCSEALMISAMLLHQFYGERLKPFLNGVSSLSEDVKLVLPAADVLDHYLTQLYTFAFEENRSHHPIRKELDHYQIGEVCKPIILDWVITQHAHVLEWTGRAFDLEDWEPLSFQQRQAASVIEVFRIIEETVDQFFGLNLPLDVTHLQALLSIIFHSLDAYLQRLLSQLVEKSHLYPSAPPLTRYKDAVLPIVKKKLLEFTFLDESVSMKLKGLTTPKLCIRLNTLQYIQKQIGILEDGIRKSWGLVRPPIDQLWAKEELPETSERDFLACSEAVDELFSTTLNCIRDTAKVAISMICDFIGARVVFWDLRDSFLFPLYRSNVENARLDSILPHVDTVLDQICGLIDDSLRDLVVLSICRASLEGYVWILLDGGPSRAFSDSDIMMMEEDFNVLKDFFVASGEGLPRSVVEQEAKFAEEILSLFSVQSETLIRMLMNASEHISLELDPPKHGHRNLEDANTLVRVLCHKKDRVASKFLKRQYQLPKSSEYDDIPSDNPTLISPMVFDLLKRSSSLQWTNNGSSSFRSIKSRLQKATSDIRNVAW